MKYACIVVLGILIITALPASDLYSPGLPPGTYAQDQSLVLTGNGSVQLFWRFESSKDASFIQYRQPIRMTAAAGEERSYSVRVKVMDGTIMRAEEVLTYVIDRLGPERPTVTLSEGYYFGDQTTGFAHEKGTALWYALSDRHGGQPGDYRLWDGMPVKLAANGRDTDYELSCHVIDKAGNRSATTTMSWVIRAIPAESGVLHLESPVEGSFANKQLLSIAPSPAEWIRYTLDGSNPANGTIYTAPVMIDRDGPIVLKVAAKLPGRTELFQREVRYTVVTGGETGGPSFSQGLVLEKQQFTFSESVGSQRYCLEDREPQTWDRPASGSLVAAPGEGTRRVMILRSGIPGASQQYRYTWVLEGRSPARPRLVATYRGLKNTEVLLRPLLTNDAELRYTLDGSRCTVDSPRASDWAVRVPAPQNSRSTVQVRMAAVIGKRISDELSLTIEFDTRTPPKPDVVAKPEGQAVLIESSNHAPGYRLQLVWAGEETVRVQSSEPRIAIPVPDGLHLQRKASLFFVDDAGNRSPASAELDLRLDRQVPEIPTVRIEEGKLVLQGEGRLFYNLKEFSSAGTMETGRFVEFTRPFSLISDGADQSRFQISAYAQDESGNKSAVYGPVEFTVDSRIAKMPDIVNYKNGGVYSMSELVLNLGDYAPDLVVHYTMTTDGTEPADPSLQSPVLDGKPVAVFAETAETSVWIKFLPRYRNSTRNGAISTFKLLVDRIQPDLPLVTGIPQGGYSPEDVQIALKPANPDDRLEFVLVPAGSASTVFLPYKSPLGIRVPRGETQHWELSLRITDKAGNTRLHGPTVIVVDKQAPAAPGYRFITVAKAPGVFNSDVEILVESEEALVRYELAKNGASLALPSDGSPVLQGALLLRSVADLEETYALSFQAVDKAGNAGAITTIPLVTLDRRSPEAPAVPVVRPVRVPSNGYVLELPETGADVLELREGPEAPWRIVRGSFFIPAPATDATFQLSRMDLAGNRSVPVAIALPGVPTLAQPEFEGLPATGLSRDPVSLKVMAGLGLVRYEMAVNGAEPAEVTQASPEWPATALMLNPSSGESVTYKIRAVRFRDRQLPFSSEQVAFTVTVDKNPPAPPRIRKSQEEAFSQADLAASLESDEGQIYYCVQEYTSDLADAFREPGDDEFSLYRQTIVLGTETGTMRVFRILAYTLDAAGNKSEQRLVSVTTIDKASIFVSNAGNDAGNGTRLAPFKTIGRALLELANGSQTAICLSTGTYMVDQPLTGFKSWALRGGYDPLSWQAGAGTTTLAFAAATPDYIVDTGSQQIRLENVTVDARTMEPKQLFAITGGSLVLERITVLQSGKSATARLFSGQLHINRMVLELNETQVPVLLAQEGGDLNLINLSLVIKKALRELTVIQSRNARSCAISESRIEVHGGSASTAIHLANTTAKIDAVAFVLDRQTSGAMAIKGDDASIQLGKLRIVCGPENRIATGVSILGGSLLMSECMVNVTAQSGATGLSVRNASAQVTGGQIRAESARDFLYSVQVSDAQLGMRECSLEAGAATDVTLIVALNSDCRIRLSRFILGAGKTINTGMLSRSGGGCDIGQCLFESGGRSGNYLQFDDPKTKVVITDNTFEKGPVFASLEGAPDPWGRPTGRKTASTVEELNALPFVTKKIEGNLPKP